MRGNHSKKQFLYLVLRQSGNMKKYLTHYKEDASLFEKYRDQMHTFTQNLFNNYINCFIKKKKHVNEYPYQYKIHMTNLHSIYLNELREDKKFITKQLVINYFNKVPPQKQMFTLNYQFRKHVKDQVKLEHS